MGAGYSGKFAGTEGAIGEYQNYQSTFFDKLPVRTKLTEIGIGVVGGVSVDTKIRKKKCFCCGEYTIPYRTENEICPVCGWIDDAYQNKHPDSLNGKNSLSLKEAREMYRSEHMK